MVLQEELHYLDNKEPPARSTRELAAMDRLFAEAAEQTGETEEVKNVGTERVKRTT